MNRQLSERAIGVLLLVCGSGLAYLSIISPLLAAARHDERVSLSLKAAGVTPLVFALGLVYTLFPERATALLGHPQKPTRLGWVFAIIFGLLGIPLYLWLKSKLREYGYDAIRSFAQGLRPFAQHDDWKQSIAILAQCFSLNRVSDDPDAGNHVARSSGLRTPIPGAA